MNRLQSRPIPFRILAFALLLTLLPLAAATAAGPPRVSQMATVSQTVGLADVSVTYSRPTARDRKIFGELVPFDEIWRTGANEATTLTVSQDCTVGGQPLAAGSYSLFTVPGTESWTIILNKQAKQWGAYRYDKEQDAVRFNVKPQTIAHVEQMRFDFSQVTADSASLDFSWAETGVSMEIAFDTLAIAKEQARSEVAAADAAEGNAAGVWADYFYKADANTAEALSWANAAVKNDASYWSVALQARLLARSGDKAQAFAAAKKAVQMGTKALEERPNNRMKGDMKKLAEELKSWSGR